MNSFLFAANFSLTGLAKAEGKSKKSSTVWVNPLKDRSPTTFETYLCFFLCIVGPLLIYVFNRHWFLKHTHRQRPAPSLLNHHAMPLHSFPWTRTLLWGITMPFIGLYLCGVISMFYNYNGVTQLPGCSRMGRNFMPSISSCLGNFFPQVAIWRVTVMAYVWQRTVAGAVRYYHYKEATQNTIPLVNTCRAVAQLLEQCGLILLSAVSSQDNLHVHEKGFILFAIASTVNMVLTLILVRRWQHYSEGKATPTTTTTTTAIKYAVRQSSHDAKDAWDWYFKWMMINVSFLLGMVWFFSYDIPDKCIDITHSFFAMCEWGYVLSNVTFQNGAYCELGHVEVMWISVKDHGIDVRKERERKDHMKV